MSKLVGVGVGVTLGLLDTTLLWDTAGVQHATLDTLGCGIHTQLEGDGLTEGLLHIT